MPRIKDRATICWTDEFGKQITEEIITYDFGDEEMEAEEEAPSENSSVITFDDLYSENMSVDKLMLTFTLENLLDEIEILKCTNQGEYSTLKMQCPEYKTLDERFGQLVKYDEEDSESKKRYTDLCTLYCVIDKTLEEVKITGSYTPLTDATRVIRKLREDDEKLVRDDQETRIEEEELKKHLLTQEKELEAKNQEILDELRRLELAHEEAIAYGKLEYKYLEKWEEARRHQAHVFQENAENSYRDIISTNNTKIVLENTIHGELVRFFNENAEDMSNETSYWMYRYENEIEARESELLKLRMEREAQMEKHLQLKATYELQNQFIDYWSNLKEERRIEAEFIALQNAAATKIQRWWRGIMKRLHLGPYRKGRKGKKGDKGKKGKKKKK